MQQSTTGNIMFQQRDFMCVQRIHAMVRNGELESLFDVCNTILLQFYTVRWPWPGPKEYTNIKTIPGVTATNVDGNKI